MCGGGRTIIFDWFLLMHLLRFATPLIEWFLGEADNVGCATGCYVIIHPTSRRNFHAGIFVLIGTPLT